MPVPLYNASRGGGGADGAARRRGADGVALRRCSTRFMTPPGLGGVVEARKATLFAILLIMPAFAGCNVKDWYNMEGHVTVTMFMDTGANSTLDHFRSIKAAVYGVDLRQGSAADAKHFTFGDTPLVVDLVEMGKKGEEIALAQFKTNLRATDRVALRIVVFEVIDAAGNPMEVCRINTQPERWPCFYQPDNAALLYDEKSFSPPRGGSIDVGFPLTVHFATKGRAQQYFLYADPGLVRLDVQR